MGTAIAAPQSGAVQVNPATGSAVGQPLTLLTGDASWLIFVKQARFSHSLRGPKVIARSTGGKMTTLPASGYTVPSKVEGDIALGASQFKPHVYRWWNLRTGKHHKIRFRKGQSVLGPTSHGLAYLTPKNHRVHLIHVTTGKRTWFRAKTHGARSGFTTPHGIVYTAHPDSGWRYQKLSKPQVATKLQLPTTRGDEVRCSTANAHYLGCFSQFVDRRGEPLDDALIPLNGATPTVSTECNDYPAVAGNTLAWARTIGFSNGPECAGTPAVLEHLVAGQADPDTTTTPVTRFDWPATAYGKAIFTGPNQDTIISIDSSGAAETLYHSPPAPVAVYTFALNTGGVVDVDSASDSTHPDNAASIWRRPVTSDGTSISLGSPSIADPEDFEPVRTVQDESTGNVATSAATTAYIAVNSNGDDDLRVLSPTGAVTIRHVSFTDLTVAGNHVLFDKLTDPLGNYMPELLDLRTGEVTDIGTKYRSATFSLWGNHLGYYDPGTGFHRVDLDTGQDQAVTGPETGAEYAGHFVSVSKHHASIFDSTTNTTTTFVPPAGFDSWSLNDEGIEFRDVSVGATLHTWQGDDLHLLDADRLAYDQTAIADHVLARLDQNGNLFAQPVDAPLLAPWSLGDPIAPATYSTSDPAPWTASIPFSEALTSCTITITHDATPERTLPCNDSDAALGSAVVSWDGTDSGGAAVAPGDYTWTLTAAGEGGDARTTSGATTPPTGTISVTN